MALRPAALVGLLGLALSGLVSCGHPATERECEEIVERIALLELGGLDAGQNVVAEEVRNAKEAFRKEMRRKCVGRRITNAAMDCVRKATASRQIEDECFR
jgi:uncharacterized protein YoaH (UPF0181 family)